MVVTAFQTFKGGEEQWIGPFVDLLPVSMFRTSLEGTILFANKQFAGMFGFGSAGELRNYPVASLYRKMKDRGDFVKEITGKGNVEEFILPFKKKDGTPIWGAVTARAVYDEDGVPVYFDGAIRDVTVALEKSRPVTPAGGEETKDDYTCILDLEGRFLSVNKAASELLGIIGKELVGKRLPEMVAPSYRDLFADFLADIEEKGEKGGVLTISDADGEERHLEFKALFIRDDGTDHHIRCIARDVTENLKKEREQKTTEKFRGVLEMAGGVSHRLNQPLTIISNLIRELLSDFPVENDNYQNLIKINHQIEKLNSLAKKISGIKKYEAMDYVAGIKIVDIDRAS